MLLIIYCLTDNTNVLACRVVVQGPGPGPRYGHVMALVGQRFLLAIGGNDGSSPFFFKFFFRHLLLSHNIRCYLSFAVLCNC